VLDEILGLGAFASAGRAEECDVEYGVDGDLKFEI
jgi:hypothetical protein